MTFSLSENWFNAKMFPFCSCCCCCYHIILFTIISSKSLARDLHQVSILRKIWHLLQLYLSCMLPQLHFLTLHIQSLKKQDIFYVCALRNGQKSLAIANSLGNEMDWNVHFLRENSIKIVNDRVLEKTCLFMFGNFSSKVLIPLHPFILCTSEFNNELVV